MVHPVLNLIVNITLEGEEQRKRSQTSERLRDDSSAADAPRCQRPQHRSDLAPNAQRAAWNQLVSGDIGGLVTTYDFDSNWFGK